MSDRKHILVIKLGALGDFIVALGPMAAIRKHHPDAHITLLTTQPFADIGRQCGLFDNVWVDRKPKWYQPLAWLSLRKRLVEGHFDRVYDLQNNDRTAFYFRMLPERKRPEWSGAVAGASHANTSTERTFGHAFDGHKQTLAMAGINDVPFPNLDWAKADLSHFDLKPPYILLVPGSAPQHREKRWPAEHYAALAGRLLNQGYQPVLLGAAGEKDVTQVIAGQNDKILDLTGRTALLDIPELARGAVAAIGNDTGPMHIIGASGCPSLVLFSSASNPEKHRPIGPCVQTMRKGVLADLPVVDVMAVFQDLCQANPRRDRLPAGNINHTGTA